MSNVTVLDHIKRWRVDVLRSKILGVPKIDNSPGVPLCLAVRKIFGGTSNPLTCHGVDDFSSPIGNAMYPSFEIIQIQIFLLADFSHGCKEDTKI